MNENERVILLDPHPRSIDLIFSAEDKARLERLGRVVWHDGSPAADEHVERYLPEAFAVIGQTPLPRERLDRAPHLRLDRKSTRLNSSHLVISYAVFCLKKKTHIKLRSLTL